MSLLFKRHMTRYSRSGELNLVAAPGLLGDFSESPVTSLSLEAERTLTILSGRKASPI